MYKLKIIIPGLPDIGSNGSHGSWQAKMAKARAWKKMVALATHNQKPHAPLKQAKVKMTRHSLRRPDHDNMVASFKNVLDGLTQAQIIIDDKFDVIGVPEYLWEKAPRGRGFITVEVIEITDDELRTDALHLEAR